MGSRFLPRLDSRVPASWIIRLAALALVAGLAPLAALAPIAGLAPPALADDRATSDVARHTDAAFERALHAPIRRTGVASEFFPETTWVGRRPAQSGNYWQVGVGPDRPGASPDGLWSWDAPIHGDSLQGWWPIRQAHTDVSGGTRPDVNRPWWAIEVGNQANYVINQRRDLADPAAPGNRTFGVAGVWHGDPGNTGAGAGKGVGWTPLAGSRSAWMGLRRHGDATATDAITGSPYNADVLMFNGTNGAGSGTSKRFPGYGSQMDQMLYKDFAVDANPATGVTIAFMYRVHLSTGKNTVVATRTGWFEGDPLAVPAANDGNFISAEAGVPANTLAPVDSFQVYVGAPAETTIAGADYFLASTGALLRIDDPLRRWFNEVLRKGKRRWLFSKADTTLGVQTASVALTGAQKVALRSPDGRLRLVFRVHTNRGFDDEGTAYSSNGMGAAQVDDITVDTGGGPQPFGDFEGSTAALDIDNLNAAAWHSTGKPPGIYFHTHDLATLTWADLCGPVGDPYRMCDMQGTVISMGDHDLGEAAGGATRTAEEDGVWAIASPTVNLVTTGPSTPNGWDITGDMTGGLTDLVVSYDLYKGIFDFFTYTNAWQVGFQSYPALQSDGTPAWGEIRVGLLQYNPDVECVHLVQSAFASGLIVTSNPSGIPDSLRVVFRKIQECYLFGFVVCSPTEGAYLDNVSIGLVRGASRPLHVDAWDWIQDTFPFTEDSTIVGVAAFDTTSALLRTGRNIAQTGGNRYDVPGDSIVVAASGAPLRLDLVFRIRPGPGNYVTSGDAASGLRRVPTSPTAASAGDGSFWGTFAADPGDHASSGAVAKHAAAPSGWDPLVWNSARCDTAEMNFFPVSGKGYDNAGDGSRWMSAYHESDSHYSLLGSARNRCFVVDTLGALGEPNMTCGGAAPAWLTAVPPSRTGWDGSVTTVEGTQILPDGLLTPGSHVEYFFRREYLSGPDAGTVTLVPDTTIVYPQALEGSLDAHRWQQFGVLPDLWKTHGGSPEDMRCMLVVDWADGRGDELAWVSIADSAGFGWKNGGQHDGWAPHPPGADLNDPAYFVNRNAQPGTLWDLYQVKGGDEPAMAAGSPGSRYAYQNPSVSNKVHGKYSKQGPSIQMLKAYYKVVMVLTGDLDELFVGPVNEHTQDDTRILTEHLARATEGGGERALIALGRNLASTLESGTADQVSLIEDYMGAQLYSPSYVAYTGNRTPVLDLKPVAGGPLPYPFPDDVYGLRSPCGASLDVLSPNPSVAEASAHSLYPPYGPFTSNVAGVLTVEGAGRPWASLVDGFGIQDLATRYGDNTTGRWLYFNSLLFQVSYAGVFCPACLDCFYPFIRFTDVRGNRNPSDFFTLVGNPLTARRATLRFGLARSDRAEIRIYDVAGRMVRTLADRLFPAGEHVLEWDGTDDRGVRLAHGVYFARARWRASGFESAKRIVLLR